jgi:hypothetical protein
LTSIKDATSVGRRVRQIRISAMSPPDPNTTPPKGLRAVFRGLGEVAAFLGEGALAVFEVVTGRWPTAYNLRRRAAKPPKEGGLIKKIAPYPTED